MRNFNIPIKSNLRRDALTIADAAYTAIDVSVALNNELCVSGEMLLHGKRAYPLAGRRVFFVGVGKCAFTAAHAIELLLGKHLTGGIALDVAGEVPVYLAKITAITGTHPLPSEQNAAATRSILDILESATHEDLVIMLVSGGGSTLICQPTAPMTIADEQTLFKELSAKGATIEDMNMVRKHTSTARGGGLAKAAYPAEVISLIVSDVPGNNIQFISSGPTVQDDSTIADAQAVLGRYSVTAPTGLTLIETPKEAKYFGRMTNTLFLTNNTGLTAMKEAAERLGYVATIITDTLSGEARKVGRQIVTMLHDAPTKTAFLYGGETTVTLPDVGAFGAGGRNQEMALSVLTDIKDDELLFPFTSDGHDNTDYAGAIADAESVAHARAYGMSSEEYLVEHRSYDFFTTTKDAVNVGYTGSNVSDFIIALKK